MKFKAVFALLLVFLVACNNPEGTIDPTGSPDLSASVAPNESAKPNESENPDATEEPDSTEDPDATPMSEPIGEVLIVSELLELDKADHEIVNVRGALIIEGNEPRLCELMDESIPPQCSGDSVVVVGDEEEQWLTDYALQTEDNISWSNTEVVLTGFFNADGEFELEDDPDEDDLDEDDEEDL